MNKLLKNIRSIAFIVAITFMAACGGGGGGGSETTPDQPDPISTPDSSVPSCSNY